MYRYLVAAIVGYYLANLGKIDPELPARIFVDRGEAIRAMRIVSKIDWRPISVFPDEAKRFQSSHRSGSSEGLRKTSGSASVAKNI